MITGETRTFKYVDTREEEVEYTDTSVQVRQPDLTLVSPAPTVTVTPDGSALKHELRFKQLLLLAGLYQVQWSIEDVDNILKPKQFLFVGYYDIWDKVRFLLYREVDELPDVQIDEAAASVVLELQAQFPCIDYGALVGNDQLFMDNAISYTIAAGLRPFLPKNANSLAGELVSVKQGPVEYKSSYTTKAAERTPEQQLLDQAWESLKRIACIAQLFKDKRAQRSTIMLAGPRRKFESLGRHRSLANPLWNMMATDDYYRIFGSCY